MERAGYPQGNTTAGSFGLGQVRSFLHCLPVSAQNQLARTVVIGNYDGSQRLRLPAGLLQRLPVQAQNRNHRAVAAGGSFLHDPAPEGRQGNGLLIPENTGGGQSGVFPQGQSRRQIRRNSHLPQNRRQTGGKGHHARLGVPGLVQSFRRSLKAELLQVKVCLRPVQNGSKSGVGVVQILPHARVLAALSGV